MEWIPFGDVSAVHGRRLLFWMVCAAPLLLVALALVSFMALDALGAHCTYPNTPMRLDGTAQCNELGRLRDDLGWTAWSLLILSVPVAALTAIGGLVARHMARRALRPNSGV